MQRKQIDSMDNLVNVEQGSLTCIMGQVCIIVICHSLLYSYLALCVLLSYHYAYLRYTSKQEAVACICLLTFLPASRKRICNNYCILFARVCLYGSNVQ